jgi:hypothetical protein
MAATSVTSEPGKARPSRSPPLAAAAVAGEPNGTRGRDLDAIACWSSTTTTARDPFRISQQAGFAVITAAAGARLKLAKVSSDRDHAGLMMPDWTAGQFPRAAATTGCRYPAVMATIVDERSVA